MAEEPRSEAEQPVPPAPSDLPEAAQDKEKEIGDFITRHVLEKDSVFFEG
jgi:hypothetical protein